MATEEAKAVLISLRKIVRYLRLADRDVEAACHLSAAQLFVLHTVAETPGLSLADVAEETLTDQSSVSTVVARLVGRGLVNRRASRADGRRAELRLTAAGQRMIRTAPPPPQEKMIAAIRAMPPARRGEVVRALDALAAAIGANEVPPRMLFEDEPPRRRAPVTR